MLSIGTQFLYKISFSIDNANILTLAFWKRTDEILKVKKDVNDCKTSRKRIYRADRAFENGQQYFDAIHVR